MLHCWTSSTDLQSCGNPTTQLLNCYATQIDIEKNFLSYENEDFQKYMFLLLTCVCCRNKMIKKKQMVLYSFLIEKKVLKTGPGASFSRVQHAGLLQSHGQS